VSFAGDMQTVSYTDTAYFNSSKQFQTMECFVQQKMNNYSTSHWAHPLGALGPLALGTIGHTPQSLIPLTYILANNWVVNFAPHM
jgi:hypothetical protein